MKLIHSGKVRDVYADGDDLILVASDRVSVYDVVLPTPIPDKGKILTQLSLWWFDQLSDLVPHHVISADDVPAEWAGRAIRCKRLRMVKAECVARGYLTGGWLAEYQATGAVSGNPLPEGLVDGSRLPEPIFTLSTKADQGHDQPISFDTMAAMVGDSLAEELRQLTLEIYRRGAAIAADRGIIIADTQLEVGHAADGTLTLGDEVLAPDSSRVWPRDSWRPGSRQPSYDKQFLRDWIADSGWNKRPPAPEIPEEIVVATRERYIMAYQQLTGDTWR